MSRVLVFGATGYMGTHLVPRLAAAGHAVRAAARHPAALAGRGWEGVELFQADALKPETLGPALEGMDVAYYLVHSMAAGPQFDRIDRVAAQNFRDAAAASSVKRIIYLGGLQPGGDASTHLRSRKETGDILRQGPVPVTELRAGVIVGAGSAAFEVIRDLVFHLPLMVTPRWVRSRSQPIALADTLEYLVRLPRIPEAAGKIYDAGGPEILTYEDMMRQFGELVGRRPAVVPVPVLTPKLSSYWLEFVTAVPANIARALIEGLSHDVLANDADLRALIPLRLMTYREAVKAALDAERETAKPVKFVEGSPHFRRLRPDVAYYAKRAGASLSCRASPADVWAVVSRFGRDDDFLALSALWKIRGWMDSAVGGPGNRRLRVSEPLAEGDIIDYWRVVCVDPPRRLTLLAEMKLPGSGVLEFEVFPESSGPTRFSVTAYFHPAGAPGLIYWAAFKAVHNALFDSMARQIARRAEARSARRP